MRNCQQVLAICAVCLLPLVASPQARRSLEPEVDRLMQKEGIKPDEPGVAILIKQGDRILFQKGYGTSHLEQNVSISPQTLFELASVSKTITATAVLMLYERGLLGLDDDVRKVVPELPEYKKNQPITIRDLLQHTSGLYKYERMKDVPARNKTYWDNEDYVPEFARQRARYPLYFATGQQHGYSNSNYLLLAVVIARISRKSYGTFLSDEIFKPCGMSHSFVYESPDSLPKPLEGYPRAVGYVVGEKKKPWVAGWSCPPNGTEKMLTCGDGAIWSNLDDMGKWDAALRQNKLIKPATMKLALTPPKTRDGKTNDYGLGWLVFSGPRGEMNGYGHEGSWGGFKTSYYNYVARDRTTIILSNRGSFDPDKFWYKLDELIDK